MNKDTTVVGTLVNAQQVDSTNKVEGFCNIGYSSGTVTCRAGYSSGGVTGTPEELEILV